jgi:hypothetical protein
MVHPTHGRGALGQWLVPTRTRSEPVGIQAIARPDGHIAHAHACGASSDRRTNHRHGIADRGDIADGESLL